MSALAFELPPGLEAHEPAESRGLRRDGVRLRIVPLFPTPEKYARIEQIVGKSAFLRESEAASPVAAPERRSLAHALPWTFVLLGGVLVLLLALDEGLLSRLELRR